MVQEMVNGTGLVVHDIDYSWRFSEEPKGVVTVTIVPSLFYPSDEPDKVEQWLTGVTDTATTVWIRSGTPLAKITSGEHEGEYGPWDEDATDGRNGRIAGLLESDVQLDVYLTGVDTDDPTVGMRYRGDIVVDNLHVDVSGAEWGGDFYNVADDLVTPLSATAASSTASVTVDTLAGATSLGKQLMKAESADAAKTALNVTTPTVDTLSGATDTGKQLMKAASAEAARTAIGAAASE